MDRGKVQVWWAGERTNTWGRAQKKVRAKWVGSDYAKQYAGTTAGAYIND